MSFFDPEKVKRLKDFFEAAVRELKAEPAPEQKWQSEIVAAMDEPGNREELTAGEKAFITGIFGPELLESVSLQKHYAPGFKNNPPGATPARNASVIHFFGPDYHAPDYSQADPDLFGTFIHEVTHVWQSAVNQAFTPVRHGVYAHTLSEGKHFTDFGVEQQATLIQNYARRFLHPQHALSTHVTWPDTPETDRLLQQIVEEQFPEARRTRLALNTDPATLEKSHGEPLTEKESALVKSFFGEKINTSLIRKHFSSDPESARLEHGSHAHIALPWDRGEQVDPCTQSKALLVMVVRIWQNQRGLAARNVGDAGTDGALLPTARFDDFSNLRQQKMIRDYFLSPIQATSDNSALIKIVEEGFPCAREIRRLLAAKPQNPSVPPPKNGP